MQDITFDRSTAVAARGSNQSGMRAYNERLVLSLVREHGALAKSDIGRITGLSAQTVSVIMRALEADGLLVRGEPVRGRVGQPSVPLSLAPDGAFFLGLKIGRRSVDLILANFLGEVVDMRRRTYRYPEPGTVVSFVAEALPAILNSMTPARRSRIGGLGIAMPFQLWNWAQHIGAPEAHMDEWRNRDIQSEIAAFCDWPVYVQNDATAACGAELVFGAGPRPTDLLYFYIGYFIGGGVVLNGRLFTGRSGNAGALGSIPVPGPDGRMTQLISRASLASLEAMLLAEGHSADALWETPMRWTLPSHIVERWVDGVAQSLSQAILSATAVIDFATIMIDGWLPPEIRADLVARTAAALAKLDLSGIEAPEIRAGSVGHQARSLGAAAIPLSQRYLTDPEAFLKDA